MRQVRPAAYAGWDPPPERDGTWIGRARGAGWAYGVTAELNLFGGHRGGRGVISVRRVSLGGGYRYLTSSVASGDGAAGRSNDLARYYASSGTPPGVFLGAGLADLDYGKGVRPGSQVSEEHLANMLVACADPVSGEALGAAPRAPRGGVPVAGFYLTFSPSKSVSVAWALADQGTKALIHECHRRAIEVALAWAEAEVFPSRSGANGVLEEDISGVVAASFTHWSSRADGPWPYRQGD